MATVFIAGHGRMDVAAQCPMVVPERITVNFAVGAGDGSTPSVSNSMIKGINRIISDTVPPLGSYKEHYLVPDGGEVMIQKADSLHAATTGNQRALPGQAGEYWLLQPRDKNAVPLSGILDYLKKKFPTGTVAVYWTCCRSPIGQPGMYKTMYSPQTNSYNRKLTDKAQYKLEGHDQAVKRPEEEFEVKHILAEGAVTLICANDADLINVNSWPGLKGVGVRRTF